MSKTLSSYEIYVLNLLSNGMTRPLINIVKTADIQLAGIDNEILNSGSTRREKNIRWAVQNLLAKGYINRVSEAEYQISPLGEKAVIFIVATQ